MSTAVENSSYMQGRLPLIHLGSRLPRAIKKSLVTFAVRVVILQNLISGVVDLDRRGPRPHLCYD